MPVPVIAPAMVTTFEDTEQLGVTAVSYQLGVTILQARDAVSVSVHLDENVILISDPTGIYDYTGPPVPEFAYLSQRKV